MLADIEWGHSKSGTPKRKFSLLDRLETKPNSERDFIETRYREFFKSRRKSHQEYSNSFEASTIEKSIEYEKSIPSIRLIREEKNKMGDILRQTLTKYKFMNLQKEKKMQVFNQKKLKYEKIVKIRQESKKEKIELSQSRAVFEKEEIEEKLKLKRSVDFEKRFKDESMLRHINEIKEIAQLRKKEEAINRFKIQLNRSKGIEHSRNRCLEVLSEEKESRKKRMLTEETKMRMSTEGYYKKLSLEIESAEDLERKISNAESFLNPKMEEIEKEKSILDSKLQKYSDFLKDGSTLKKINFTLMKTAERKSVLKIKAIKTDNNEYEDQSL